MTLKYEMNKHNIKNWLSKPENYQKKLKSNNEYRKRRNVWLAIKEIYLNILLE
jgi:hypothetical protein